MESRPVAAAALGLKQTIIQLVRFFAYPVLLVVLIPFFRLGESVLSRPHLSLPMSMLTDPSRARAGRTG